MSSSFDVTTRFLKKMNELAGKIKLNPENVHDMTGAVCVSFDFIFKNFDCDELGAGEKGSCHICTIKENHDLLPPNCALLLKCPLNSTNNDNDLFLHEMAIIAIMWFIGHPNFVCPVVNSQNSIVLVHNKDQIYAVMEVIDGLPYSKLVEDIKNWSKFEKLWLFVQLVDSVNFMHTCGYSHCDLHFGNIIVRDKIPVIIDLGSMTVHDDSSTLQLKDLNSLKVLFRDLFRDLVDNEEQLPYPFSEWLVKSWPSTVSDLYLALGDMGTGPICSIETNGSLVHVPCHVTSGIYTINLTALNMQLSYADYVKTYFAKARNRQMEAIRNAIISVEKNIASKGNGNSKVGGVPIHNTNTI